MPEPASSRLVADIKDPGDAALLHAILGSADVFIQNLAPGAAARAGFGSDELRARHPRLVTVEISGYGENGAYADMKAYDLLVGALGKLSDLQVRTIADLGHGRMPLVDISIAPDSNSDAQQIAARLRAGSPAVHVDSTNADAGILILVPTCLGADDVAVIGRAFAAALKTYGRCVRGCLSDAALYCGPETDKGTLYGENRPRGHLPRVG
jgi:hypothetical protein